MKQKIQISISEPCHENWQNMTLVEKGRFCSSCQKTVLDFTHLSDNEIIKLVSKNENLCGRISISQLNRDLIPISRKSNYFGYFATSVLAFLGLGAETSFAQEKPIIEQTDFNYLDTIKDSTQRFSIKGKVFLDHEALIHVTIFNKTANFVTESDQNGQYNILVSNGDVLVFSYLGLQNIERVVKDNVLMTIQMKKSKNNDIYMEHVVLGQLDKNYTFFGRTFRKIGNWFR